MIVFLLQLAETVTSEKYTNFFTNALLLTLLRTDTGYSEPKCKHISDLIFCAYFHPGWMCGEMNCYDLAKERLDYYISQFSEEKLRYLLIVETPEFLPRTQTGEPMRLEIGDINLKNEKGKFYSEPLVLQKFLGEQTYTLQIRLIIKKKKEV